jgi:hypothetical protein
MMLFLLLNQNINYVGSLQGNILTQILKIVTERTTSTRDPCGMSILRGGGMVSWRSLQDMDGGPTLD